MMRWLLRCYPRVWRERYEDEMMAILEEHRISVATVLDLLLGACDAHLHCEDRTSSLTTRIRVRVIRVLCAFIVFGVGWSLLLRLSDPVESYAAVVSIHPELGLLFDALRLVGGFMFLIFLAGGVPLVGISVRRAWLNRRRAVLARFGVALAAVGLSAAATLFMAWWHPVWHADVLVYAYLLGYLFWMALLLVAGTTAVAGMIGRTEFALAELERTAVPERMLRGGMAIAAGLATALYVVIAVTAPQLFQSQDVGHGMNVIGIALMMVGWGLARGGGSPMAPPKSA